MENRIVRFVIDVEYEDWWNDDEEKWMPPSWECVIGDVETAFNIPCKRIVANGVSLYDDEYGFRFNTDDVDKYKLFRDIPLDDTDGVCKLLEKLRQ